MKKLLITGANGLLGSNLSLTAQKDFLVWLTDLEASKWWNSRNVIDLNITDKKKVVQIIESIKPKLIIHCAALTNVDYCEEYPNEAFKINFEGTRNIVIASNKAKAKLIYISTDSVFNGENGNYSENDNPSPINEYAKSKLLGEKVIQEETDNYIIIRTNLFGWNKLPKESLAEWIIFSLKSGKKIKGFTDVIFSPLLVNNLSEIILELVKRKLTGIYHLGAHDQLTKNEFAIHLAKQFGLNQKKIEPASSRTINFKAARPLNTSLNVAKIESILNKPMPTIRSGIKNFHNLWISDYIKKLKSKEFLPISENGENE